jgi:hypothetical protein
LTTLTSSWIGSHRRQQNSQPHTAHELSDAIQKSKRQ